MKPNQIIRASAGTGKTFSLATRFLQLMIFDHVAPARIVALTFSRAAAQEIYTKLLERLWSAAACDEAARKEGATLAADIPGARDTPFTADLFARILRHVIDAQEGHSIATLDSFILRIVRSFPLEMGFQQAVNVLDEFGEKNAITRAQSHVLDDAGNAETLAQAFRTAQQGDHTRAAAPAFSDILSHWRPFLIDHPESANWDVASMCRALGIAETPTPPDFTGLAATGNNAKYFDSFRAWVLAYDARTPPIPDTRLGEMMIFFATHPDATTWEYDTEGKHPLHKVCDCGAAGAAAVRAGVRYLLNAVIRDKFNVVAAKLKLCAGVERAYDALTRRQGLLTFADFTQSQAVTEDSDRGLMLQNLQFRFDERFDHWALDEFQDTSALQWLCLRRLVREAADDPARSVMIVGDLKQSIYGWRGGNDAPFCEVMNDWDAFRGERGEVVKNDISYRYALHTANFINRVFGPENLKALAPLREHAPDGVRRWLDDSCWMTHRPETRNGQPRDNDYVALVGITPPDNARDALARTDDEDESGAGSAMRLLAKSICALTKDLWTQHEHTPSGKASTDTIAILVRNNRDGAYLAERLRAMPEINLPVVWEGADDVLNEPVVRAILELLNLALHPEDTFSWVTVNQLFPIRARAFPHLTHASTVSEEVARLLSQQGLARTLREIIARLGTGDLAARARECLERLVNLATRYETRSETAADITAFPQFLALATERETTRSPHVVRILTIHRSKGLTFDHVIAPILETGTRTSIIKPHEKSVLSGAGWALEMPATRVVEAYPPLRAAAQTIANEHLLAELRTYYVALTRARTSTYVLTLLDPHAPALQFRDILLAPFAGLQPRATPYGDVLYESGARPAFGVRAETTPTPAPWQHAKGLPTILRHAPSKASAPRGAPAHANAPALSVARLFAADANDAIARGLARHAAYAALEWPDEATRATLPAGVREAFIKPSPEATVWRERRYELYANGVWETGQFDRVVFTGSGDERAATLYDFKTNTPLPGESAADFRARLEARYAEQMLSYRNALARLTGIPLARITSVILPDAS